MTLASRLHVTFRVTVGDEATTLDRIAVHTDHAEAWRVAMQHGERHRDAVVWGEVHDAARQRQEWAREAEWIEAAGEDDPDGYGRMVAELDAAIAAANASVDA